MKKGVLVLKSGHFFQGLLHGDASASGEVIFNTSLTGYQEILSDPSYKGQMVTMTYPHIGNYGVNPEDMQSSQVHASGLIVKELTHSPSNWRSHESLEVWLRRHQVIILEGIDTRALVKIVREGECMGLMAPLEGTSIDALKEQARSLTSMEGQHLARMVSTPQIYSWKKPDHTKYHVVAYDFGIKTEILEKMRHLGMAVTVVPYNTSAESVLQLNPQGIFLSNGPGDPAMVVEAIDAVRQLLGKKPIFGICLGHQILATALGCQTYKLLCGHHGGNHPVIDCHTRKVSITSHNHGFAVDEPSLPPQVQVTHRNLNDGTVEGIESIKHQAYSVQYHPEAAPGPHDAWNLFDRFMALMDHSH